MLSATTAGELVAAPDRVAPVSGERCRGCGHSARRDPPDTEWFVLLGSAYCTECRLNFIDPDGAED